MLVDFFWTGGLFYAQRFHVLYFVCLRVFRASACLLRCEHVDLLLVCRFIPAIHFTEDAIHSL